MSILLLTCPSIWVNKRRPVFPLGLAYIGTYLKKASHRVRLMDLAVYREFPDILEKLSKAEYFEIIGVNLRNLYYYSTSQIRVFKGLIKLIRQLFPSSKVVCGGPGFSLLAEEFMRTMNEIDLGVVGEGEEAMLEIIENRPLREIKGVIFRQNDKIYSTGERKKSDFNKLPIPKRDWPDLDLSNYESMGIQTKRGCCFHCAYCTYPWLEGSNIRCRNIESVKEEIEYVSSFGIKNLFFVDSVFNYPLGYSEEIIDYLRGTIPGFRWEAYFKANNISKRYIMGLQEAGCKQMWLSVESGSQKTHKALNTGLSISTMLKISSYGPLIPKNKMKLYFMFMIGIPGEKLLDVIKTLFLISRLLWKKCLVNIQPLVIEPRSELAKKMGISFLASGNFYPYKKIYYLLYWCHILKGLLSKYNIVK